MSQQFVMRKGMTAMDVKIETREWAYAGKHRVILRAACDNVIEWLALKDDTERAERIGLLIDDVNKARATDKGTIVSAETASDRTMIVAVRAKNSKGEEWNSPRLFDAVTFALIRLLIGYGGTVRMNDRRAKDPAKQKGPQHFFPAITWGKPHPDNFAITRISWGARTTARITQVHPEWPSTESRDIASQVDSFYDLRLMNLKISSGTKPAARLRKDALAAALVNRTKYELRETPNAPPPESEYRDAIEKCFTLLDALREAALEQRAGNV
jgi:hypothetical protein